MKLRLLDGFANMVANIGTPRDKAAAATYLNTGPTPEELAAAYRTSWLARKAVDIPAQDAVRRWRSWNAGKEQISAIEAEETRLRLKLVVRAALTSARLFGGAVIYMAGPGQPEEPLSPGSVGRGGLRHLTVMHRDVLSPGQIETDPESALYGLPAHYEIARQNGVGLRVHPSRLVVFHGAPAAVGATLMQGGWGDSCLTAALGALKQADGVAAASASLVTEANVDVLHLPGLMKLLQQPGGDVKVGEYLSLTALNKGINGMLVLDGGETIDGKVVNRTEYDRKGAAFGGLADVWDRFMQAAAGATDIPATRLFGMSPAGMNSTGESDLQNYAQRIAAIQAMEVGPAMAVLDECLIRSALGARPADIHYDWRPIWETTAQERVAIGTGTAGIIATLSGANILPPEVLSAAAANAMIETGALPGLEGAINELGLEPDEPDDDDDLAAVGGKPEDEDA